MEPHQSIPNLVVKLYRGDNTVEEALRENNSMPGSLLESFLYDQKKIIVIRSFWLPMDRNVMGPVAQWIRARGYEPRCRGFESLLAHLLTRNHNQLK